ncbi:hypothetical protein WJX73_009994 [Symbiochloris irregularis]|uniref:Glutaredoxin-dependent peroxiredoxin n=1 Tax=Symbiochloris irregularis TaxID=706552 RepID=A0AAW1NX66_9CHLO
MAPKAGDSLPDATLYEGAPDKKVTIKEAFGNKTGVLLGVPGAFTPTCSKDHLPGFISDYDKFKAAGAEVIVCIAVNDPFVMAAWGEATKAGGKVRLLADTQLELTKALGTTLDAEGMLGSKRTRRFSAVIKDGKFVTFNDEQGGGLSCSTAQVTLDQLKSA